MAKHLLQCTCGRDVEVEQRQAGGQVSCTCGNSLEVPPLGKLRLLPVAEAEQAPPSKPWSPRNAVIAAALIVAIVAGGAATYIWATMHPLMKYDARLHQQQVEQSLEEMAPLDAWQQWLKYYAWLDDSGFSEFRPHGADAIEAVRARDLRLVQILGGVAGVALLTAIIVAVVPAAEKKS